MQIQSKITTLVVSIISLIESDRRKKEAAEEIQKLVLNEAHIVQAWYVYEVIHVHIY